MNVYIAGAMTGEVDYNYAAFVKAAKDLKDAGYHPVHTANQPRGLNYATYIGRSFELLADCDCVLMLDGWKTSRGALMEYDMALKLDKPIYYSLRSLIKIYR